MIAELLFWTSTGFYFVPERIQNTMQKYEPIHPPFYSREFPVAWRDIDRGIHKE